MPLQTMTNTTDVRIVEEIAEQKNVDPMELDYRLYDCIDPDALLLLADHGTDSWTLSFECPDGTVTVTADGDIQLDFSGQGGQVRQDSAGD